MPTFKEKQPRVEAMKFKGGRKSFNKVRTWLREKDLDASWCPKEGNIHGEAMIILNGGTATRLYPNTWIVFKSDRFRSDFNLMFDDGFKKQYEGLDK